MPLPADVVPFNRGLVPLPHKSEGSIRSLSVLFLHDLQRSWEKYGEEVLQVMARKYTPAYYAGIVSLARVMRIELGMPGEFERPRTPEEIIDKLEDRIGPKGRKLFEDFVREINKLQAEQQLEQQERQQVLDKESIM